MYLTPCYATEKLEHLRWTVRLDRLRAADVVLCARLNPNSNTIRDFLLIDGAEAPREVFTLGADPEFEKFRLPSLEALYLMRQRSDVPSARGCLGGTLQEGLHAARKARSVRRRKVKGRKLVHHPSP